MALNHTWDVNNGLAYVLTFFSLISDSLGCVRSKLYGGGLYSICFLMFLKTPYVIYFDNIV